MNVISWSTVWDVNGNSRLPHWSYSEVHFASFPLFYSTSFGELISLGWLYYSVSWCKQPFPYEYRRKAGNLLGERPTTYFWSLTVIGTICIGAVVRSFFTVTRLNWEKWTMSPGWSLEASRCCSSRRKPLSGSSRVFLGPYISLLYFMNNIKHDVIYERSKSKYYTTPFLFVVFYSPS